MNEHTTKICAVCTRLTKYSIGKRSGVKLENISQVFSVSVVEFELVIVFLCKYDYSKSKDE